MQPITFWKKVSSRLYFQRSLSSLSALVNAMNEDNVVAVVRRVYRAGTAPKLGVLIPEEDVDLNSGTTRTVMLDDHISLSTLHYTTCLSIDAGSRLHRVAIYGRHSLLFLCTPLE